jgi:hypothetical protein
MSPKVHEEQGFRFIIYYNDHAPAHVHAINGDEECRIGLDPVEVIENYDMKPKNIRKALAIVSKMKIYLLNKWDEIYPSS